MDGSEYCILPGFIDGHTHPVWSGSRVNEFSMKLDGASYMDIHAAGGGIHATVRATSASSKAELSTLLHDRLDRMLRLGTTTVEAKSGYGLCLEEEMKLLEVLHEVEHPVDVIATYLGAHAIPEGSTPSEAVQDIVEVQIPALIQAQAQNRISPQFIDVFCERGVFNQDETRQILEAGKSVGWGINFHGDELHCMHSGALGAQIGATAISHLEQLAPEDILQMRDIVAVLLPTTKYFLNLPAPPARALITQIVAVSLASDFNPNAHCLSLPLPMHLGCVMFHLTMNEALAGVTINAAASINQSQDIVSLEVGKWADLVLVRAPQWEHVIYELGDPPIAAVVKRGEVVSGEVGCSVSSHINARTTGGSEG